MLQIELFCSKICALYPYIYSNEEVKRGGNLREIFIVCFSSFFLVEFITDHVHVMCNKRNRGDKASTSSFSKHLFIEI